MPHGRRVRPWRGWPHDRAHGPRRRLRWPRRVRLLSRPVRGARPFRARRPHGHRRQGTGEGERSRSPRPKGRANTRPRGRAKARCGPWRLLSPAPSSFLLVLLLLDWVFGAPHHAIGTPPHTPFLYLCRMARCGPWRLLS